MPRSAELITATADALGALLRANGHVPEAHTEDEYGEHHDSVTRCCSVCHGGLTASVYDDRVLIHGTGQRCQPEG